MASLTIAVMYGVRKVDGVVEEIPESIREIDGVAVPMVNEEDLGDLSTTYSSTSSYVFVEKLDGNIVNIKENQQDVGVMYDDSTRRQDLELLRVFGAGVSGGGPSAGGDPSASAGGCPYRTNRSGRRGAWKVGASRRRRA